MKTPKTINPFPWLAGLLLLVAMWGCKRDRDDVLSTMGSYENTAQDVVLALTTAGQEESNWFSVICDW